MIDDVFADGAMPILDTLTPTCCSHANQAVATQGSAIAPFIYTLF